MERKIKSETPSQAKEDKKMFKIVVQADSMIIIYERDLKVRSHFPKRRGLKISFSIRKTRKGTFVFTLYISF